MTGDCFAQTGAQLLTAFEFDIDDAEAQGRADRVIVRLLEAAGESVPRAEVHRWIDAGLVTVDGKRIKRAATLPLGRGFTSRTLARPSSSYITSQS